jgi:hypothetical protein
VFDIEMAEKNFGELVEHIAAPEPTFRGANIEDIKPPDCFYVERALRARMKIPGCPRRRCVSVRRSRLDYWPVAGTGVDDTDSAL